jgi:hypothetical protein
MKDDHSNAHRRHVLLIFKVPIGRDEHREPSIQHEPQEPAIPLPSPTFIDDVRNGEVGK